MSWPHHSQYSGDEKSFPQNGSFNHDGWNLALIIMIPKLSSNQWSGARSVHHIPRSFGSKITRKDYGFSVLVLIRITSHEILGNASHYQHKILSKSLMQKCCGKLSHCFLFLQDNVLAYTSHEVLRKIRDFGFELVDHPSNSPDLAPSDYYFFPKLKKHFKRMKFHSDSEVIAATVNCLKVKPSEFY